MSKFYSLYNNPRHTMLVTPDGSIAYEVKSEHEISTIKHFLPTKPSVENADRPFAVVGTINWSRPQSFTIGTNAPVKASHFFQVPYSDNKFKKFLKIAEEENKREFTGTDGQTYVWKLDYRIAELRRKGDPEILASYTMERGFSLPGTDPRATLLLSTAALNMVDLVIFTWVPIAVLLNTFRSKGIPFSSPQTQWALSAARVDVGTDY